MGYARRAQGEDQYSEVTLPLPEQNTRLLALQGSSIPPIEEVQNEQVEPTITPDINQKPSKLPSQKKIVTKIKIPTAPKEEKPQIKTNEVKSTSRVSIRATASGCVRHLLVNGYYVPPNPKISAKTLPVDNKGLPPEGKTVVVVTYEGKHGHVAAAKNVGGKLVVVTEGNFPGGGKGRVISKAKVKGYLTGG